MCLDCSGVTTENSAICVCFSMKYGDSVVLVTLTAILLSIIVDIERENSRIAVSVNFSNGVTVPVVFHFDGWLMKAVIVICRRWWYGQGFVSDDWLWFGGCVTWGRFNLHCQVGEMYEAVCRVKDYTVIPYEMQPNFWPCCFLHYDEVFSKWIISNFKFEGSCW